MNVMSRMQEWVDYAIQLEISGWKNFNILATAGWSYIWLLGITDWKLPAAAISAIDDGENSNVEFLWSKNDKKIMLTARSRECSVFIDDGNGLFRTWELSAVLGDEEVAEFIRNFCKEIEES